MRFDVIVIGGGHAGIEAAAAAARMNACVALVTFAASTIGAMSCNPAIGGLGKGHIVREVDAFDGVMAVAADAAAIHHRMLNASKGSAVRGPRIQADRVRYAAAVQGILASLSGLSIVEGEAAALCIEHGRCTGIRLVDGMTLNAAAVVLATGTFLGGKLFTGDRVDDGGRIGERPATLLAKQLRNVGLPLRRLKTGTPPRLDGRTIDWARLSEQPSDDALWTMSALTAGRTLPQVACAITRTNIATHRCIRENLHRSPLFTGAIAANGPRYCPSIEDKVERFGDRDGHQIFLEPEGLDDPTVYPNGISTSLPPDVQATMLRTIVGLERAVITAPGYAVEYAHIDPRTLDRRLAIDALPGVYCAGQINGTTGYEEAAGQGLVAGINAAADALGRSPLILERTDSYIGVMIDDLVLQGVTEPYRMLTARAEYRLALRADNAATRLGGIADSLGCLSPMRRAAWLHRQDAREAALTILRRPQPAAALIERGAKLSKDQVSRPGWDWLRSGGVELDHLRNHDAAIPTDIWDEVADDARYAPYLERQVADHQRVANEDTTSLRHLNDYADVPGLSAEMIDRLGTARPVDLAEARRVRGVTPAALTALLLHARSRSA